MKNLAHRCHVNTQSRLITGPEQMVSFYNYWVPSPRLPPQLPPCPAGSPLLFPAYLAATAQPDTALPATGASPLLKPGAPSPSAGNQARGPRGLQPHLGRWPQQATSALSPPTSKEKRIKPRWWEFPTKSIKVQDHHPISW